MTLEETHCTKRQILERIGEPEDKLRFMCMYMAEPRKSILEMLVMDAGGHCSHGMCEVHYEIQDKILTALEQEEAEKNQAIVDGGPRRWRLGDLRSA